MSSCAWYIGRGVPLFSPKPVVDNSSYDAVITLPYDTATFTSSMSDALASALNFVRQSIKPTSGARSAAATPGEDDTYQNWIDWRWNVPSNVYGTDTDPYNNTLTVNGEYLGRMQNLVHHRNAQGKYERAVFQYKGHLYYVLPNENNGWENPPSLSSENDYSHVFLNMADNTESEYFSDFGLWRWYTLTDGSLYRGGNCGHGYTLRNVKMLDGSFATVTICWTNADVYGYRVWITEGKNPKKQYPDNTDYDEFWPDNVTEGLDDHLVINGSGYDYVYEVVNNSGCTIKVQSYLIGRTASDYKLHEKAATTTRWYTLNNGDRVEFRFSMDDLLAAYQYTEYFIAVQTEYEGEFSGGWWFEISNDTRYKKGTLTYDRMDTWGPDGYWDESLFVPEGNYNRIDLSVYADELDGVNHIAILRRDASSTDDDDWEEVMYFDDNNGDPIDTDTVLYDYYAEAGKSYSYTLEYWDSVTNDWAFTGPVNYTTVDGLGELTISKGTGILDAANGSLKFTTVPSITSQCLIGSNKRLVLDYQTITGDTVQCFFEIYSSMENNAISIRQAYDDAQNASNLSMAGKTLYPFAFACDIAMDVGDHSTVEYVRYLYIESGDTAYPGIAVSSDGQTYTSVPNEYTISPNGGMTPWERDDVHGDYIQFDLSQWTAELEAANARHVWIERKKDTDEYFVDLFEYTSWDDDLIVDTTATLTDYYVEPGQTYEYRLNDCAGGRYNIGTFTAVNGLGEFTVSPGAAAYNSSTEALEFSSLPTYSPEAGPDQQVDILLKYDKQGSNEYICFYSTYLAGYSIPLSTTNINNPNDPIVPGTYIPVYYTATIHGEIGDYCGISYHADYFPSDPDPDHPSFTITE